MTQNWAFVKDTEPGGEGDGKGWGGVEGDGRGWGGVGRGDDLGQLEYVDARGRRYWVLRTVKTVTTVFLCGILAPSSPSIQLPLVATGGAVSPL